MIKHLPERKQNRLDDCGYTNVGLYFITICTKDKIKILGNITNDNIELTKEGIICKKYLREMEAIFDNIVIDEYIIMLNHIHMIIGIKEEKEDVSISKIIKKYKSSISRKLGYSIWQKSYYDHIIRNEEEFNVIKQYIKDNIINWNIDKYF